MQALDEKDPLYVAYHNHKQQLDKIAPGVFYLGHFGHVGPIFVNWKLHIWNKASTPAAQRGTGLFRSLAFQEKALDATLADLKDCVVFSTTPTYYSQYLAACLLKQRGFKLLEDKCYLHPSYTTPSNYKPEHPGIQSDRQLHKEHIWWKVIGRPTSIGQLQGLMPLNNCGVDAVSGLEGIQEHESGRRSGFLTVAWMLRGTLFPKGWKRFFSAEDYKLGVNFDSSLVKRVEDCPHNFDLKVFEGWEPDFEKWTPL